MENQPPEPLPTKKPQKLPTNTTPRTEDQTGLPPSEDVTGTGEVEQK